MKNLYKNLHFSPECELVSELFSASNLRVERIASCTQTTDWQVGREDEWVCLLKGEARLEFVGKMGLKVALESENLAGVAEKNLKTDLIKACDNANFDSKTGGTGNFSDNKNLNGPNLASANFSDFDDERLEISLSQGDTIFIPAGAKHRVSYTSERCLWLCIFATAQSKEKE